MPSAKPKVTAVAEPEPDLTVPVPTANRMTWYPAIVQVDGGEVHHNAKVYAAREGLYVYTGPPTDMTGETPDFFGVVDYAAVAKPPTGWRARHGFTIPTDRGSVTITLGNGCGCGRPLMKFTPEFSKRVIAWDAV